MMIRLATFATALICWSGQAFSQSKSLPLARVEVPASVAAGEIFEVHWAGPGAPSDTIRIGTKHGNAIPKASWTFASKETNGIAKLKAPTEPGYYTVVYFQKKQRLADTALVVRAPGPWVLANSVVQQRSEVAIFFGDTERKEGDLIGIVEASSEKPPAGKAGKLASVATAGGVIVTAPQKPGDYEAVYFSGGKAIARQPIKVENQTIVLTAPSEATATLGFEVGWRGRGNAGDRIMLFSGPEKKELNVVRYMAHIDAAKPTVWMNVPETPGHYELRYKLPSGRMLGKKAFTVVAPDEPTGTFRVNGALSEPMLKETMFEVIVDTSGAMKKEDEGDEMNRLEAVKTGLIKFLQESFKEGGHIAIRTIDEKGSRLIYPLQQIDHDEAIAAISKIELSPMSKRPVAAALAAAADDLKETTGDAIVILITSGDDNAGGDPALAIRHLRKVGSSARVAIISYGVTYKDHAIRNKFLSWAELGRARAQTAKGVRDLPMCLGHAMSTPYEVFHGDTKVANGQSATAGFPLPAGDYQVRYPAGIRKVSKDITIKAGEHTDISIP